MSSPPCGLPFRHGAVATAQDREPAVPRALSFFAGAGAMLSSRPKGAMFTLGFAAILAWTLVDLKPPTVYEWLSLFVSIAGFIAILVTLFQIRDENRLSDRALKEGVLSPLKAQQLEIDKIFIEHPDLRKYFYDRAELPEAASHETAQAMAVAEFILDHFAAILPHTTVTGEPLLDTIWRNYIRDSFANSRVLSLALRQHSDWYPSELRAIEREATAALARRAQG